MKERMVMVEIPLDYYEDLIVNKARVETVVDLLELGDYLGSRTIKTILTGKVAPCTEE